MMPEGAATFDISFITLTWNSDAYLRRCLDSIIAQCSSESLRFEIIVVDNGSRDGSAAAVQDYCRRAPDSVTLIALDRNRGTTYPRNLALKRARGAFICVLDSDTEFLSGSIRPLLGLLAADAALGIVAPRLELPDGTIQHSVKQFPTILAKLRKVPWILAGRAAPRADFYPSFPFDCCTLVETAISACWFFRADLPGCVGYLDEGIFYAPEDVEYSARVWAAGKQVLYYPHLSLLHHTQQISHRRPFSRLALSHMKGLIRYHRKHGGWFVRAAWGPTPLPVRSDTSERLVRDAVSNPPAHAGIAVDQRPLRVTGR
jgi:GT2 family glycosyltransferase